MKKHGISFGSKVICIDKFTIFEKFMAFEKKKKNLKCVRSTIAILVTRNLSSSFIHAHVSLVKGKQS